MAKSQPEKYRLSMAGEFGVCSELSKRGYDPSITLGNAKAVDIYVPNAKGGLSRIEVKTSRSKKIVTNVFQKYFSKTQEPHPDFWVLVYIDKENVSHYYVLTHEEMGNEQMRTNGMTTWGKTSGGVDNVPITDLADYENAWNKIPK